MLEPIEFPKARAGASLIIEETLTNISGIEVPRATSVIPIITSLIPNLAQLSTMMDKNLSSRDQDAQAN